MVLKKKRLNIKKSRKTPVEKEHLLVEDDPKKLTYYIRNLKLDSIELVFSEKPSEELRILIRNYGFKWGSKTKVWYRKFSSDAERAANLILKKLNLPETTGNGEGDGVGEKINSNTKSKRGSIGSAVKNSVWLNYWGKNYQGKCWVCTKEIENTAFQAGHIISRHNGGGDHIENLVPVCGNCNGRGGMDTMCMIEYKNKYYSGEKYKVDSLIQPTPEFTSACNKCNSNCMGYKKKKYSTKKPEIDSLIQPELVRKKESKNKESTKMIKSKQEGFKTNESQWNRFRKHSDKARKMLSALHMSPAYLKVSWSELDEGDQKKVSNWIAKNGASQKKTQSIQRMLSDARTDR